MIRSNNGATLWIEGEPRKITSLEVTPGPNGTVRIELVVPLSHVREDNGGETYQTDILLFELDQQVAADLASDLGVQVAKSTGGCI